MSLATSDVDAKFFSSFPAETLTDPTCIPDPETIEEIGENSSSNFHAL
ncbi:hypothetical protein Taro_005325 [Colocasia esculenta]|uniref:Uncharacterized protein n=1 Tax=Colocasia esculenta TaxID=4460 RepID=A0A843TS25_COLES|nr:hypothetical protein [Colocasia esculenta]